MSEAEMSLPAAAAATARPAAAGLPAKARGEASGALFGIAFLQLCFTVTIAVMPRLLGAQVDPAGQALAVAWTFGLGAIFAGLGVWARFHPLAAAAVGLGVYVVLALLDVASAPERVGKGLILQLLLAALLARAIRTCLKARRQPV